MGRQSRRKRRGRDDLQGTKYQFTKAYAEEVLQGWSQDPGSCRICGEKKPLMAQVARRLTDEEIARYRLAQECAFVVITVCSDCMEHYDIKDRVNAVIHESLSSRTATEFDLGRAGVPPSLREATKKLFGFEA